VHKRGLDIDEVLILAHRIASGERLPPNYRDHWLSGAYSGMRECHVRPDWLLIYEFTDTEMILLRTGTHQDLFGG
jgi:mRNA interferase YafQ